MMSDTHLMFRPVRIHASTVWLMGLVVLLLQACSDDSASTESLSAAESVPGTPQTAHNEVREDAAAITVLALGDSLTEGLGVQRRLTYPAQLQQRLHEQGYDSLRVVNAGFSGETTSGLLTRLNWVLKQKPDIVILTIGANDAMRGIPLDLVRQNLDEIIRRILETDAELILGGMQIYNNLGRDYVSGFSELYDELASEYSLRSIPFFLDGVAGDDRYNQADQIHPTAEGYTIIVNNNVMPALMPVLEAVVSERDSAARSTSGAQDD